MNLFTLLIALAAVQPAAPEMVTAVSSPMSDYNLSIDEAQRTLVVARSEADFRNARILVVTRTGTADEWGMPQPISFSDPRWSDSDPWLTPDGHTLYFISTRPARGREEGRTDYDIWRSVRTADGWSEPEHIPEVSSRGQELGPELHEDILYFSSARHSGRGGLDIYAAPLRPGGWGPAVLLDGPFNSVASESDFTLSADGRTAAFWRAGDGGRGTIHIALRSANGWSEPTPLPSSINHGPFNFTPSFASDGRSLFYASTREREGQESGLADIYRTRLP